MVVVVVHGGCIRGLGGCRKGDTWAGVNDGLGGGSCRAQENVQGAYLRPPRFSQLAMSAHPSRSAAGAACRTGAAAAAACRAPPASACCACCACWHGNTKRAATAPRCRSPVRVAAAACVRRRLGKCVLWLLPGAPSLHDQLRHQELELPPLGHPLRKGGRQHAAPAAAAVQVRAAPSEVARWGWSGWVGGRAGCRKAVRFTSQRKAASQRACKPQPLPTWLPAHRMAMRRTAAWRRCSRSPTSCPQSVQLASERPQPLPHKLRFHTEGLKRLPKAQKEKVPLEVVQAQPARRRRCRRARLSQKDGARHGARGCTRGGTGGEGGDWRGGEG